MKTNLLLVVLGLSLVMPAFAGTSNSKLCKNINYGCDTYSCKPKLGDGFTYVTQTGSLVGTCFANPNTNCDTISLQACEDWYYDASPCIPANQVNHTTTDQMGC